MPPPSNRLLRRLIAELAALDPADMEAVIARLEPHRRQDLRELLRDYLGAAPSPGTFEPPPGLSPWLAERIGHKGEGSARRFGVLLSEPAVSTSSARMTPAAAEVLRAAVASCRLVELARQDGHISGGGASFFQRLRSGFRPGAGA